MADPAYSSDFSLNMTLLKELSQMPQSFLPRFLLWTLSRVCNHPGGLLLFLSAFAISPQLHEGRKLDYPSH